MIIHSKDAQGHSIVTLQGESVEIWAGAEWLSANHELKNRRRKEQAEHAARSPDWREYCERVFGERYPLFVNAHPERLLPVPIPA